MLMLVPSESGVPRVETIAVLPICAWTYDPLEEYGGAGAWIPNAFTVFAPAVVQRVPSGKLSAPPRFTVVVGLMLSVVLFHVDPSGAVKRLVALMVGAATVPVVVSCVPCDSWPKSAEIP